MRDGEWQLVYGDTAVTFGPADLPIVNMSAPDLGDIEVTADDVNRPRADGVAFGVDYRGGRTITFDLGLFGADEADVRATLRTLARAWRADPVRLVPGATAELHVQYAGAERVVYGRPRRFAAAEADVAQGVVTVAADFACVDDLFYDPADQSFSLGIVPPPSGGLITPLASPLTTTATSDRSTGFTVGGDMPAWPVITIHGPITNPEVEVVGQWTIGLNTSLASDQSLTIDTRPWARTILLSNGGSLAGTLTAGSARLASASLPPGDYEAVLRGTDQTGTASLTFAWRNVYTHL